MSSCLFCNHGVEPDKLFAHNCKQIETPKAAAAAMDEIIGKAYRQLRTNYPDIFE